MSGCVGYFQICKVDSIRYEIRKNTLISQTYIANFRGDRKIIINLPWQFRLSRTINIHLDDTVDPTVFDSRIKNETTPSYLFINGSRVPNNNIIMQTWAELLG